MYLKQIIKAAHAKLKVHRWIAWLLCAALVGGMISSALPALAVNGEKEEGTLCEHHPEHTEECGYVEAVEGQPCTHEHDENCGYAEGQPCTHEHDESCGYVKAAEGQDCTHEHDEECGYVEAVEGQSCGYVCEICGGGLEELPEEEIEQDVAAMADEPMALAAANEKGLIAEFMFNDVKDRLKNSAASSGVTAKLHEVKSGEENDPGKIIENGSDSWGRYFDGTGENENALHLNNTACLVLENTDAFKGLTELTVEMKVKITGTQQQQWLFYARRGTTADDCLGAAILNTNNTFRAIRGNKLKWVEWKPSGGVLTVDEWHTIRVVYKISTMAIYIDEKRVNEEGAGGRTAYYFENSPDIWLGHSAFKDTNFTGYIDDVRIYNYARDDYPIDEQKYIVESADPPNTTVHMFDYWITGQEDNDYNPPIELVDVRNKGINEDHLFLFAGWNAAAGGKADSPDSVGSWNSFIFDQENRSVTLDIKRAKCEPFSGIVNNILGSDGYPQLALDKLEHNTDLFQAPTDGWYKVGDKTESLGYLFNPYENSGGKASYPNVKGLFRLDEKGYYYFDCYETFAELNRDQGGRPKKSTGNNRITLYERESKYKDFFPFNDATDLFYITMEGKLDKANGETDGMSVQATTDEPFNHYFGMTVETKFQQPIDGKIDRPGGKESMIFDFTGDDDVWIFIDDVLVADLGGLHEQINVNIDFSTGEIDFTGINGGQKLDGTDYGGSRTRFDTTLKDMFKAAGRVNDIEWNVNNNKIFADGSEHTLKFFYMERGNSASRCTISFNLQLVELNPPDKPSKKHKTPEEQLPDENNTPEEQLSEEIVTLNVSADVRKKKDEEAISGVLASPNTGDSNMVGLWSTLLVLSAAGLAAIHRTRKRGNK